MSVRVGLGLSTTPFADAKAYWRWVELCEESDVDSIWQTDRLTSKEPYLESLSAMAALAGATDKLRFGMNAVVVSLRDPLLLAKQCATIDFLSRGRLLPVFGVGSNHSPEWEATGQSARRRGRRADEALEIMTRLWSEESVDFEGEFYHYRGASIAPRPVQKPLPVWIGGSSPAAIRRTARFGTGWLAGVQAADELGSVIDSIRKASAKAGRPVPEDHYGATFIYRLGSWDDPAVQGLKLARSPDVDAEQLRGFFAVGDAAAIRDRIAQYHHAGASKFVLIPAADSDADLMDQTRRLAAEVLPEVHGWP